MNQTLVDFPDQGRKCGLICHDRWSTSLDITNLDYLHIALFFISIMLSVVFFLAWKTIEHKRHTLLWSILFATAALNGVMNAAKELFPSTEIYWILVNAVSLIVSWLAWAGFRYRANRNPFVPQVLIFLVLVELVLIWFTIFSPHMGIRTMLIPCAGGLMMFACAREILASDKQIRAAEIAATVLFIIYGSTQFVAGIVTLMQGVEPDDYYLSLYNSINFLLMPASFTGLGIFTILILVDDLGYRMKLLAITDQLTGLYNRRGFDEETKRTLKRAKRHHHPISIAMTDLDHFKTVNDKHGHLKGDDALKLFANLLLRFQKQHDVVARIGGEEFALMIYDADFSKAKALCESIRKALQEERLTTAAEPVQITASFGISEIKFPDQTVESVFKEADQALYKAKRQGRNRVEIYQP